VRLPAAAHEPRAQVELTHLPGGRADPEARRSLRHHRHVVDGRRKMPAPPGSCHIARQPLKPLPHPHAPSAPGPAQSERDSERVYTRERAPRERMGVRWGVRESEREEGRRGREREGERGERERGAPLEGARGRTEVDKLDGDGRRVLGGAGSHDHPASGGRRLQRRQRQRRCQVGFVAGRERAAQRVELMLCFEVKDVHHVAVA
jgi:hypothetical protein